MHSFSLMGKGPEQVQNWVVWDAESYLDSIHVLMVLRYDTYSQNCILTDKWFFWHIDCAV